jgi:hypothetical protein
MDGPTLLRLECPLAGYVSGPATRMNSTYIIYTPYTPIFSRPGHY